MDDTQYPAPHGRAQGQNGVVLITINPSRGAQRHQRRLNGREQGVATLDRRRRRRAGVVTGRAGLLGGAALLNMVEASARPPRAALTVKEASDIVYKQ